MKIKNDLIVKKMVSLSFWKYILAVDNNQLIILGLYN